MKQKRIKIFSRSFSLELYSLSKELYKCFNWPTVRLTDQSADGYFYKILNDRECDIAINIDEDAFVCNPQYIKELVDFVIAENYANAGAPDGGNNSPRGGNPIITNPFFNILNLELIRSKYEGKKSVKNFCFKEHLKEMENSFPKEILTREGNFNVTDLEPYYPFFFWLSYNFKTLYLPTIKHNDNISTIITTLDGKPFLYHSWFARFFNLPSFLVKFAQKDQDNQRDRINKLIDEVYSIRNMEKPVFGFSHNISFVLNLILRWAIKIPQRVIRWPKKIIKRITN